MMACSTSQRIDENDMNDSPSDEFLALQNRNLNLDKNSIINLMCHNKSFLFGFISAEFFIFHLSILCNLIVMICINISCYITFVVNSGINKLQAEKRIKKICLSRNHVCCHQKKFLLN